MVNRQELPPVASDPMCPVRTDNFARMAMSFVPRPHDFERRPGTRYDLWVIEALPLLRWEKAVMFPPVVSDPEVCVTFSPEWEAGGFVSSPDGQHSWRLVHGYETCHHICRYCGGRRP